MLFNKIPLIFIAVISLFVSWLFISSYDNVMDKLGFETKTSLSLKLKKSEEVIKQLQTDQIAILAELNTVKQEAIELDILQANRLQETENAYAALTAINEERDAAVSKAKKQKKKKPKLLKTPNTTKTKPPTTRTANKDVSEAQINALWKTYQTLKS